MQLVNQAFSIFDTKTGAWNAPFFQPNETAAMRMVSLVMEGDNMLAKNPGDFQVYLIGQFSAESGILVGLTTPKFVCSLREIAEV